MPGGEAGVPDKLSQFYFCGCVIVGGVAVVARLMLLLVVLWVCDAGGGR